MKENKKILIGLAVIVLVVSVLAYLYYAEQRRQLELEARSRGTLDVEAGVLRERSSGTREVRLYFYRAGAVDPNSEFLVSQKRSVFQTGDLVLDARQIVNEVIKGDPEKGLRVLPEAAKLRQIYVLEEGTAVVDLSHEASEQLVGGITSELSALYSISRSLVENIDQVKRVRFLVEGEQRPTFAGHVSIREPFM